MVINLARIFHVISSPACLHSFWLTYHYITDDFLIILSSVACLFCFWLAVPSHRSFSFHNLHTYSFTKLPSSQILQILSFLCVQTLPPLLRFPTVPPRNPVFQCSTGSACFWDSRIRIRILLSSSKNSRKNLDSYCFVTSFGLFVFEKWSNCAFKK